MQVVLLSVGAVSRKAISGLGADLRRAGMGVTVLPSQEVPAAAYETVRDQYRAIDLLDMARRAHGEHVLAVTEVDLYADPLTFVFGQADVDGRAAVISLNRLGSEESALFRQRALTEALHELGHNVGLDHCRETTCVMYFSHGLDDTDRKGPNLCAKCTQRVGRDARWRMSG